MAAGRRAEDGGAPPLALQWAQRGSAGLCEARLVLKAFVDTSSGERRDHKPSQGVAWRGLARPGAARRGHGRHGCGAGALLALLGPSPSGSPSTIGSPWATRSGQRASAGR